MRFPFFFIGVVMIIVMFSFTEVSQNDGSALPANFSSVIPDIVMSNFSDKPQTDIPKKFPAIPVFFVKSDSQKLEFQVEVVETDVDRESGLMFRESLAPNEGMLFKFEHPDLLSFWMKNTLIPLDMIFIDENFIIVKILENVQPCKEDFCPRFSSEKPVKYVVEINGGLSEKMGISVGGEIGGITKLLEFFKF